MTLALVIIAWVAVTSALAINARRAYKQRRQDRANRSMKAWVNCGGKWFED